MLPDDEDSEADLPEPLGLPPEPEISGGGPELAFVTGPLPGSVCGAAAVPPVGLVEPLGVAEKVEIPLGA